MYKKHFRFLQFQRVGSQRLSKIFRVSLLAALRQSLGREECKFW